MGRRVAMRGLGLVLAAFGLTRLGRWVLARGLSLSPPRYRVAVERNLRVAMPDGVVLLADHYAPRAPMPCPTILLRTGYGRGRDAGFPLGLPATFRARRFAERGYHVVVQTTRGRFDSGGTFAPCVDAATDGRATLAWVARQPWFNGALGLWGPSWLGYVQWAVAADAPPYLKALVPSVATPRLYPVVYPDGVFALDTALRWLLRVEVLADPQRRRAVASPRAQDRLVAAAARQLPLFTVDMGVVGAPVNYYREWLAHPEADDPYWRATDHRDALGQTTAAIHLVSGWYDLLCRELLADFAALTAAGRAPYLTVGPWHHSQVGVLAASLREGLAWFDAHLKGECGRIRARPVRYYVMGANEWREADDWPPPARTTRYYLQANAVLASGPPGADASPDRYCYDPAAPTPALGGALLGRHGGPRDNRPLEARADVLCYTTAPLARALEVIGPVRLELFVHSSLAHTDFFGRLCDVAPDGRSRNVCDGLVRLAPGRGVAGPGASLRLAIDLGSTAHRFARGHRLRLQVSSGAHPRYNRNLGTGEPLASATRLVAAAQTIYHDAARPSALIVPAPG